MAGKADGGARRGSSSTDIPAPMLSAASKGLTSIRGADTAWMSPGVPMQPIVPDVAGRQFDFRVATNLVLRPRGEEAVSFGDLRGLADAYYLVRLAIETRKDQLVKLKWKIKPTDPKANPDARCDELNKFFNNPDKRHNWQDWLRQLIEELLVIDAPAVYFRQNLGDRPYAFELIDGATLKILLDTSGRVPLPPEPAYQQNLKGIPAVDYTSDEVVYKPRNPRVWKVYGFSPVEQVMMIVNIGLRREISQLQFYTEGNIPEAIMGTPDTWNPDQVKKFQDHWDSILEGNTAARRHAKFVPGKLTIHETKTATLTDEFDEWLARVIMYAFSLPSSAFTKQVNRATAETAKEQAEEEGLAPLMQWVQDLLNYLIVKYWGYTDIGFSWEDEKSIDPLIQAQIHDLYLKNNTLIVEEVRADLGREAFTPEQQAKIDAKLEAAKPGFPQGKDDSAGVNKPAPADDSKPDDKKKHAHTHDVKKKTYAKLSPTNVKRAKKLAGAYTKFFKTLKADVIKQVVAAYGRATKADSSGSGIPEDLSLDFTAILQVSTKTLTQAAKEGTDDAAKQLGAYADELDLEKIAAGIGDYNAAELIKNIDPTTRDMVSGDIDEALKEGWSTTQLADALEENYAFSESRAETIARTEVARADVEGSMEAYRSSGVVTGKRWLLAEEPCPICEDNANDDIIDIDENFSSGDDAPPAHPNCECDVEPIIETDNEEE